MSACTSFAPVYAPDARALVVGSMPGVQSLTVRQYYAHPRNAFWPILFGLWGHEPPDDYGERLRFLTGRGIALWDVAHTCQREGSLDIAMRAVAPNDFAMLFAAAPGITEVFCNGGTAYALYARLVQPHFPQIAVTRLPSTSPALTMPIPQKLEAWRALSAALTDRKA